MFTIAYHTLGCKVNQYETEKIREALELAGFATVPLGSPADVYVINTCSVTDSADSKSRAIIRKALRTNPGAFIVVAGCYAELEPARIAEIEGVGLVVANKDKDAIPERILAHFASEEALRSRPDSLTQEKKVRPRMRTRAVVKVQDGCDQFCSYCVIPYARSQKISRPVDDILAELGALAKFGYKEIVLTGIRLGSYHHEFDRLPELLAKAAEIDGIERIRLSSIEAWEIDDAVLDALDNPKVCRHLHIPLQSGDDGVLKRMNRPYSSAQYFELISRVRRRVDGVGITTDVIVGFPGETDVEFENTCSLIEEIGFSRLHVFRYSPRQRTKAAAYPEQVDAKIKKIRADKLMELGTLAMRRFALTFTGRMLNVLVETEAKEPKHHVGFADNYIEVHFPGDSSVRGEIVRVQISGVNFDGIATGRIVD